MKLMNAGGDIVAGDKQTVTTTKSGFQSEEQKQEFQKIHRTEEGAHMAIDIFLSYSRNDRLLAEQFVKAAAARGVHVWFDEKIEVGQNWRERIVDALGTAKAFVILFSEYSNGSRQLIKELAIADNLEKLVIPVLISNCEPQGAYLYELSSRNWINIYPNPETQLAPLIDTLKTQLELRSGSPPQLPVSAAETVLPAPWEEAPSTPAPIARPAPAAPAHGADERWFPLGRYDLYILVPILVGGFLMGIAGAGFVAIASLIYMFVIGVRNARLNRSVFSAKSFASYFAVLVIGWSPIVVSDSEKVMGCIGVSLMSLILAMIANVVQLVVRKIFYRDIFRSKIGKPLARAQSTCDRVADAIIGQSTC